MDLTDFTDFEPGTSSTDPLRVHDELDQPRHKSVREPATWRQSPACNGARCMHIA